MEVHEQQVTLRRLMPSDGKVLVRAVDYAREQAGEMLDNGDGTFTRYEAPCSTEIYLGNGDSANNYIEIDE